MLICLSVFTEPQSVTQLQAAETGLEKCFDCLCVCFFLFCFVFASFFFFFLLFIFLLKHHVSSHFVE